MADDTHDLLQEASRGDEGAVETLLERYLPELRGYLRRHAGGLLAARESSSDLVQSVCREVLEHLADERLEYRGEAEFRRWLYEAAVLKLRTRRRFWRADKRDAARELPPTPEPAPHTSASPSQEAARNEDVQRVRATLDRLPPRYREIVLLSHFEDLSHRDIATRLGISETHSRVLLSRALARLATLGLSEEG